FRRVLFRSLRYLAGGRDELEEALPVDASRILGVGLIASATAILWPMLLGEPPLTSHIWDITGPLIGDSHIAAALLFDLGVYLIVLGRRRRVLQSLGGQPDRDEDMRRRRAGDRARRLARSARREAALASTTSAVGSGANEPRPLPTVRPVALETEPETRNISDG